MQNLIKITRDTKAELEDEVRKYIQKGDKRVVDVTVLPGLADCEAWLVVEDLALAGFE